MAAFLSPERSVAGDPVGRRACRFAPVSLLVLCCLLGCRLVDQTTFGGKPQKPPPDILTQALQPGPPVPLVTIVFNGGEVAYAEQLRLAVQMAEARKPEVQYDVVTAVPARGSPADQARAAKQGESDAIEVADEMNTLGVDPTRIHMSARTDPRISNRELRIYVR